MREDAKLTEGQIVLTIHDAEWSRLRRRWRSRWELEFRSHLTWLDENDQPAPEDESIASGEFCYSLASGVGLPVFGLTVIRLDASRAERFDTFTPLLSTPSLP